MMSTSSPVQETPQSLSITNLNTLRQIFDFVNTVRLLLIGFVLPELKDTVTSNGMVVTFDPAKDIGSLDGKVILVTGGIWSHLVPTHNGD